MNKIQTIYDTLYKSFGPQGWWPTTPKNKLTPVHHGIAPRNEKERFEIIIGAILTQNTNWKNVEKAIHNLNKTKLNDIKKIKKADINKLGQLIRPAGYYNQKAERLKIAANFFLNNRTPNRTQILNVKGIGPETADSILLYSLSKPSFVVDAYTKRIFQRLGILKKEATYEEIKELFESNLKKDLNIFKEYHALIVELGKNHCKTKPICNDCPLSSMCKFN